VQGLIAMARNNNSASIVYPVAGVLTLLFVLLKVTGATDWSWWWVTSPLWLAACMAAGTAVGALFLAVVAAIRKSRKS
jgi:hypothetical protein